ncbi:MAG: DNA polymerase I, partial [Candidatus Margulisbacteria bacterium]|nr:DNA polymerase I [Candidatus Margulisiibacteriota bacterium]
MSKSFMVIDGYSLAYRAFFALPTTMTLPDGKPINAVFGFLSLLLKGLDAFDPDYVCVCFDLKEPTFRHKTYKEYKAHRPPAPPEFISQIPLLHEVLETLSITALTMKGFEADDIMGTLAKQSEEKNINCLLVTGDHDAFQLVSKTTSVVMNKKGVSDLFVYTPQEVEEKYQLRIDQVVDMKALKGDASDNIPGVRGVGEKTAVKLLQEYDTLEGIYNHIDDIKGS